MSELRKAFELWAVKEELDITSVDFSSGSIRATDKHGKQIQFCYEEIETATAWEAWQEQQKKLDVLQKQVDAVRKIINDKKEVLSEFENPNAWDECTELQYSIAELEEALQGDTNA